jgi:hypothetical protein
MSELPTGTVTLLCIDGRGDAASATAPVRVVLAEDSVLLREGIAS